MKRALKIIGFLQLLLLYGTSFSQAISNRGKEFWVGYGHHQFMETGTNTQNMVLYLSAEDQPATVTVTIDSSGIFPATWWRKTYVIPAFTVIQTDIIPKGSVAATGSDPNYDARLYTDPPPAGTGGAGLFRKKGVHIESNVPIVAYAHIYGSTSSGATMLLPVEAWGYTYVSLNSRQSYASNCYNWMYVVASKDNTVIQITPSVLTRAQDKTGLAPGVTKTFTLMKGQMYQLIGANDAADANGNGGNSSTGKELSGTIVKSLATPGGDCFPIAVFAGSSRTSNPASCGSGGGDNDNQQLFPQHAWGRRYLTAPFSSGSGVNVPATSTFKIAVKDANTVIRKNGVVLTGLQNNNYYQYESNTADYIESDKPITIVQFMTGGNCMPGNIGDPSMCVLSPMEQGIKRTGFYRNTRESIQQNFLTLIVPTNGLPSLRIDNSANFDLTYAHPRLTGYSVVVKRWSPATIGQAIASCDSSFTAITYGLGSVESYAYNAGTNLINLNAVADIHNLPDTSNNGKNSHKFTCTATDVKLSVLMRYQPTKIVWKLNTLCASMTPCANVTMDPASNFYVDSVLVDGIKYYRYTLPGIYNFNKPGIFNIGLESHSLTLDNCNNKEDLNIVIEVKEKPIAGFTFSHTGCEKDTVFYTGPTKSITGTYDITQWKWTLAGGALDSIQNPKQLLTPGTTYATKLYLVSQEGCDFDTTIALKTVFAKPTAKIGANPQFVCVGQNITFSDTSSYGGTNPAINKWYWDFNNGRVVDTTNGNNITILYPVGDYTIKHVVKVTPLCISDTAFKIVKVSPGALVAIGYPTGCLPPSGVAQFTAPATDLGGQAIVSYSWNFGDANATAGNPNTSSAQNPTHTYTVNGTYAVKLSVVTASGCAGDTIVNIVMNVAPTLAYSALNAVCENNAAVNVANGSVTNGVPGNGKYRGPGTDTAGVFTPAIAGAGTHTIWYVFTSTGGCKDSVSQTIKVNAKPKVTFGFVRNTCLPTTGFVQFADGTTISDGQTFTHAWDFGDVNANAGNPNSSTLQNPTHNFKEGNYNIKLTATSVNGCIGDSIISATFKVTPQINYPALAPVCENNTGTVSVATATISNGVTGSGIYKGPGTTNAGIFDPAVAGPGTHTIKYIFTTTGGCIDSASQTIGIAPKPKAAFTFPTGICLPTTGLVQFTNGSTVSGGGTLTYKWKFNDANATAGNPDSSIQMNPTHIFKEGTYSIKLTVISNSGCSADTTISATFKITPSLAYSALTPICESNASAVSVATATVTNGVTGSGIYKGPGTSTSGIFNPATAGSGTHTIWYVFTTTGGCIDSISQIIAVAPKPKSNFTFPTGTCLPTTGLVQFTNASTITGGGTLTYKWKFNDANATAGNPDSSLQINPTHIFKEGSYSIKLTVTSNSGCSADTTISATFKITPALNYPPLTPFCQSGAGTVSVATATVTNGVTGSGIYKGPGTDAAGNFNSSIAGSGTHTIWYVFTTTGGCKDSISRTIAVSAKPKTSFSFPMGTCLPTNGQVQFTNGSTISNGQTLTYAWNFGDANANAGNPNTSTATNPTHIFQEGNYTIKLTATSTDGCMADSIITTTFKITPALAYTALTPFCESATSSVSVATASVTNGVTGNGIYKGPGTSAAGSLNTAVAGPGTHTIWYVFTTTGGCVDSISRTITIKATPKASFTTSGGCLPQNGLVQFTNGSTISNSETLNYLWNFGDANANAGNPNTSTLLNPSHFFQNGTYTIKLTVTSATGNCVKDTSITASFSLSPQLAFQSLSSVCASDTGTVSVAKGSVVNGVPGSGIYKGPGTDTLGNFRPSTAGAGTHTIWYVYTSSAGCKDSLSRPIKVHPKPTALFAVSGNEICADKSVVITNQSSTNTATYAWDFGDGTTATTAGPFTKMYNSINSFTIKLTVVSDSGCTNTAFTRNVTVNPLPVANFDMPASVCMLNGQGTVLFTNQSTIPGGATLNYTWNFGDASPTSNAVSPSHTYFSPGPFNVNLQVTSAKGCIKDTTRILPRFFDKPTAIINVDRDSLCQGAPSIFTNLSIAPNSTITSQIWRFGDGSTSTAINPVKTYQLPGNYTVSLAVRTAQGCPDTGYYNVRVYLQPVIDAGPSFIVPEGTTIRFNPTVNDSSQLTFIWSPAAGLSAADSLRPNMVAMTNRVYTLTATGQGKCTASDTLSVKVLLPVVAVNAFSPNGDGINDTWELRNLKDYPGATVEIYNRYGQAVFHSNGYTKPWDGTLNGKPLPIGVYYYIIQLKNGFPQLSGSITLLK